MFLCTKCLSNFKETLLESSECPICGNKGLKHYEFYVNYTDYEKTFREEMCEIEQRLLDAPQDMKFEDALKDYLYEVKKDYNFNSKYYNMFLDQYNKEFKTVLFNIIVAHFFDLLSQDKVKDTDKYLESLLNCNLHAMATTEWTMKKFILIYDVLGGVKSISEITN